MDVLAYLGFSETSPLYTKLVIDEQKVDVFGPSNPDHVDPYLFTVQARVKDPADMEYVRDQILETIAGFRDTLVDEERLAAVKSNLRYSFALSLNNSEAIAETLAHFMSLRDTPETINRIYEMYAAVTPADIQEIARKYLVENGRTIVTLSGGAQ
jgi:zinc protease